MHNLICLSNPITITNNVIDWIFFKHLLINTMIIKSI